MSDAVSATRSGGGCGTCVRSAHPKQALFLAAVDRGARGGGRTGPQREFLASAAAVLAVQLSLGLSNDLCDQHHDYRAQTVGQADRVRTRRPPAARATG